MVPPQFNDGPYRIAIDMDEVLADSVGKHLKLYREDFGEDVGRDLLTGLHLSGYVPEERRQRVEEYVWAEDFFSDLDVIPGSQEAVAKLMETHEVFVASAAMEFPASLRHKHAWMRKHFPDIPWSHVVLCGDKSILHADFLIDDTPRNFTRFSGQGIIFTAPHNIGVEGFPRARDWPDVVQMFGGT